MNHRVQSPTSGAWHPCGCWRGQDHVGTRKDPQDDYTDEVRAAFATLRSRGVEIPADPVILVMPEGMVDIASDPSLIPWPPEADSARGGRFSRAVRRLLRR